MSTFLRLVAVAMFALGAIGFITIGFISISCIIAGIPILALATMIEHLEVIRENSNKQTELLKKIVDQNKNEE